jgi:MoxR-like ATPase
MTSSPRWPVIRAPSGPCEPPSRSPRPTPDPAREHLVLDADSSQQAVIDAVRSGANLVIKGPPGTGKSQTIANLIAVAGQ